MEWRLNVCITVVSRSGADSHQVNSHIRGSTVCSVVRSTVPVLAEDFCNQFRDFSSLYGPAYTSLLIFTEHFTSLQFYCKIQVHDATTRYQSDVTTCLLYTSPSPRD